MPGKTCAQFLCSALARYKYGAKLHMCKVQSLDEYLSSSNLWLSHRFTNDNTVRSPASHLLSKQRNTWQLVV